MAKRSPGRIAASRKWRLPLPGVAGPPAALIKPVPAELYSIKPLRDGAGRSREPVVSLDGNEHLRIDPGKPAPSANARVPVFSTGGAVIGEVSVGFPESDVAAAVGGEIPLLAGAAGIALLLGALVSLLLARRLKRDTLGLELDEIAALLDSTRLIAVGRESLRRVTALVAQGVPTAEVLSAVEALGGTISVASPPGDGTVIRADLPLGGPEREAGSPR
jgi:two-component system CitB family sensor kinase